jgi:hypothetical protein
VAFQKEAMDGLHCFKSGTCIDDNQCSLDGWTKPSSALPIRLISMSNAKAWLDLRHNQFFFKKML